MSDFDTVLERLVTDPAFARALAADPAAALAGYHLAPDEVALLRSQVSTGDAGGRAVEERASKASMLGLFGALLPGQHGGTVVGRALPHGELGPEPRAGFGPVSDTVNPYDVDPNPYDTPPAPAPADHIATDYHAHIDADGDGRWDKYVAVRHADGSVDVYEDRNGDGRIDFVGHDANGDGILESADYDENFDGVADVHMADTNGDGWMDTRRPITGT